MNWQAKYWRGRRVLLACEHCDEIFSRRTVDARRAPHHFCSRDCHAASMRTGRVRVTITCSGCGAPHERTPWEIAHKAQLYCSRACYERHVDRVDLGRRARAAEQRKPSAVVRFLRAQAAGLARARKLTKEELSAIGKKGAAARLANAATRPAYSRKAPRAGAASQHWVGPVLVREEA